MEENEIITGNRLIAEFMELQTAYQDVQIWMDWKNETIPLWDKRDYWLLRELKYHTSWDWLMPVVDKIENLDRLTPIAADTYYVEINATYIEIGSRWDNKFKIFNWVKSDTKLEAVYTAVIQFITYHNTLNPPTPPTP